MKGLDKLVRHSPQIFNVFPLGRNLEPNDFGRQISVRFGPGLQRGCTAMAPANSDHTPPHGADYARALWKLASRPRGCGSRWGRMPWFRVIRLRVGAFLGSLEKLICSVHKRTFQPRKKHPQPSCNYRPRFHPSR
jgi:hypothetical protein